MSTSSQKSWHVLATPWFGPAAASLFLVAVGGWGLLKPEWLRYRAAQSAHAQAAQTVRQLQGYQDRLGTVAAAYSQVRRDSITQLSRLDKVLPQTINNAHLFSEFQQVIEGNGLVLVGMRITPDTKTQVPRVTTVSFTVNGGNYPALKRLLAALEKNIRLTDAVTLSFDAQVQMYTITVRLYSLR